MEQDVMGMILKMKSQYEGRKLSTDEYAEARNTIREAIKALEDIELKTGDDHLLLKWGTLKSWHLHSKKGKQLLEQYHQIGSSQSALSQHDTPEQKELICQMIEECDGSIQSDWTGEYLTKHEAKEYIRDYE